MNESIEPERPDDFIDESSPEFEQLATEAFRSTDVKMPWLVGESILEVLRRQAVESPRVRLAGAAETTKAATLGDALGFPTVSDRYRIHGEVATGGMGTVYRGHDRDLGRDVAIKVLRSRHLASPALVKRFIEEAQIGGQLQHPNIVPVFDAGACADRRPFFTMKLVQGSTLADLMKGLKSPQDGRTRLLAAFGKVLDGIAYAHGRGVVHRDVKPANIMVGDYGDVKVMDWGLARLAGAEDTVGRPGPESTGGENDSSVTIAGSVIGTPAYMSPEQARGEVDQVDKRSDVFALGAILCEILTGAPPYTGDSADDVRQQASAARLEDAYARLDRCDADADLVALCRRSLAGRRDDRPRDAGEVEHAFENYQQASEDRARRAELVAARAEAKATESRRRAAREARLRRLTQVLGGALVIGTLIGAGGYLWFQGERNARARQSEAAVSAAESEAVARFREAQRSPAGDLANWAKAEAAARTAVELADAREVDAAVGDRVRALAASIASGHREAEAVAARRTADRALAERIEAIIFGFADHHDFGRQHAEFMEAFAEVDIDVNDPDAAAARISGSTEVDAIASGVQCWAFVRSACRAGTEGPGWESIFDVVERVRPSEWHARLRTALAAQDRAAFKAMAMSAEARELPPRVLDTFAYFVGHLGAEAEAIELYRLARRRYPGDFAINHNLAHFLVHHAWPARVREALEAVSAALALRPESALAWEAKAMLLVRTGRREEAREAFVNACRFAPDGFQVHYQFAMLCMLEGRLEEALALFEKAGKFAARDDDRRSVEQHAAHCRRSIELARDLATISDADWSRYSLADLRILARLCLYAEREAVAADLWQAAFERSGRSGPADEDEEGSMAIRAALLAGTKRGAVADDAKRTGYRVRSCRWMHGLVREWAASVPTARRGERMRIKTVLETWMRSRELAPMQSAAILRRLPDDERKAWTGLWRDARGLLDRLQRIARARDKY